MNIIHGLSLSSEEGVRWNFEHMIICTWELI